MVNQEEDLDEKLKYPHLLSNVKSTITKMYSYHAGNFFMFEMLPMSLKLIFTPA